MSCQQLPPRWVVATPEWVEGEGSNVEVIPSKYYFELRKIIADAVFREMNGLTPVIRNQASSALPASATADSLPPAAAGSSPNSAANSSHVKRCEHFWGYIKPYRGRTGQMMKLERCNHCGKEQRARLADSRPAPTELK